MVARSLFRRSVALLALLCAVPLAAQPIVARSRAPGVYSIGPYPVSIPVDKVRARAYATLFFFPVIEGRGSTFKLYVTGMVQLTGINQAIRDYVTTTQPQDNCAHVNNLNLVVVAENTNVEVVDPHSLRIRVRGSVTPWLCTEGVPETVCDTYTDSFGIEWPSTNCRLRPTKYKFPGQREGAEFTYHAGVSVSGNKLVYKTDQFPNIAPEHNTILQNLGFAIADLLVGGDFIGFANSDISRGNAMAPPTLVDLMPNGIEALHPTLIDAWFETIKGEPFVAMKFSISASSSDINRAMRDAFASVYIPFPENIPTPAAAPPLTKTQVRNDCADYMRDHPGDTIENCAALMGLPYSELPD